MQYECDAVGIGAGLDRYIRTHSVEGEDTCGSGWVDKQVEHPNASCPRHVASGRVQRRTDDECLGLEVFEVEGKFLRAVRRVERRYSRSLRSREKSGGSLGAALDQKRDAALGCDTTCPKTSGDAGDELGEGSVCERAAARSQESCSLRFMCACSLDQVSHPMHQLSMGANRLAGQRVVA